MTRQRLTVKEHLLALVILLSLQCKAGTNANIISIEYRSVIFTISDAQTVSAKLVTEEIQAKHFTPKGKCFLSFPDFSPCYQDSDSVRLFTALPYYIITLLFYWVLTSNFPQTRRLSLRFYLLVNGGMPRTIIKCTSPRTLVEKSVQPIDFTGRYFVGYHCKN